MAEIDGRFIRQHAQASAASATYRRPALEEAPAAERKQRVGGKEQLVVDEVVTDMPGRMPRGLYDLYRMVAEQERIAVGHRLVEAGDRHGLVDRADDLAAILLLQRKVAFDVVRYGDGW